MKTQIVSKKILQILMAALILFAVVGNLFVGLGSIIAHAADEGDVIDPNITPTLTVHKYKTTANPYEPGTGLELDDNDVMGEKAGAGVIFSITLLREEVKAADGTVTQTGVNDTTKVEDVTAELANYSAGTDTVYYGVTNTEGVINEWYPASAFSNTDGGSLDTSGSPVDLTQGYWYLEEVKGIDEHRTATPTIVTLPLGYLPEGGTTTKYNYNVHVYPKNVDDVPIKKEVIEKVNVYDEGDPVTWKITGSLNYKLRAGDAAPYEYGSYVITDTIDKRLDVIADDIAVQVQRDSGMETLIRDTDYTVTTDVSGTEKTTLVMVRLLESGIEKVTDWNSSQIFITIPTKVNGLAFVGADDDLILNGAEMTFEQFDENDVKEAEKTIETEEDKKAHINLTRIEINKVNVDDDAVENAKFKVAASEQDAKDGNFLKDADGNEVEVTTNAAGEAYFSGLPIDSSVTPDADGNYAEITYYLWETAAPDPYEKSQKVWAVKLTPSSYNETYVDNDGNNVTVTYTTFRGTVKITNYKPGDPEKDKHFNLPLTGGVGTAIFMVAGLLIIAGTTKGLMKSKKRR